MNTTQQSAQMLRERRSNWAGFAFFSCWTVINLALAAAVFRTTPVAAIFLVPTFAHDVVIAVAFLIRRPLRKQAEGWLPRLAAYGATLLMPAFCFAGGRWFPEWMQASAPQFLLPGVAMWLMGACLGLWSVYHLRKSFSIVPQARGLVTEGPYGLARHPVYASYLLQYGGFVLAHLTPASFVAYLAWLGVVLLRISYEESVLSAAFPEYAGYRRRVGMFMPRWAKQNKPQPTPAPGRVGLPSAASRSEA